MDEPKLSVTRPFFVMLATYISNLKGCISCLISLPYKGIRHCLISIFTQDSNLRGTQPTFCDSPNLLTLLISDARFRFLKSTLSSCNLMFFQEFFLMVFHYCMPLVEAAKMPVLCRCQNKSFEIWQPPLITSFPIEMSL